MGVFLGGVPPRHHDATLCPCLVSVDDIPVLKFGYHLAGCVNYDVYFTCCKALEDNA